MPDSARVVISDNGSIWLTAYAASGEVVPVELMPVRAVALARELLTAAVPKISGTMRAAIERKPIKRRGGDRQAQKRRQRDADFRALANLTGKGKSLSRVAQDLIQRCERYQPKPGETSPDRILLQRINDTGLPVPGVRRMLDILS